MYDSSFIIFSILGSILQPLLIIGIVWYIFFRRKHRSVSGTENEKQREYTFYNITSELFLLFSVLFLSYVFIAVNRDVRGTADWYVITFCVSIVGLVMAYRFNLLLTLFFSIIGIFTWWGAQGERWLHFGRSPAYGVMNTQLPEIKGIVLLSGFVMLILLVYVVGRIHQKSVTYQRFSSLLTISAILSMTGVLFAFAQRDGLRAMTELFKGQQLIQSWQLTLTMLVFAVALITGLATIWKRKYVSMYELYALVGLMTLFAILLFVPEQQLFSVGYEYSSMSDNLTGRGFLVALFFNLLLFFFLIGIIFSGYNQKEIGRINLGAVLLFIFIFVKYFDWFFTYLDKSLFFISAGMLLFVVGYFMERGRRVMIAKVTK